MSIWRTESGSGHNTKMPQAVTAIAEKALIIARTSDDEARFVIALKHCGWHFFIFMCCIKFPGAAKSLLQTSHVYAATRLCFLAIWYLKVCFYRLIQGETEPLKAKSATDEPELERILNYLCPHTYFSSLWATNELDGSKNSWISFNNTQKFQFAVYIELSQEITLFTYRHLLYRVGTT